MNEGVPCGKHFEPEKSACKNGDPVVYLFDVMLMYTVSLTLSSVFAYKRASHT